MRLAATLIGAALGALAATAALRASFAEDAADAAFDSPQVKELAARADELKLDDEVSLLKRIRRSLDVKLLTPPADAWKGFEDLRNRTDAGLARILNRGPYVGIVSPREGGAYWSFSKRSNDYDDCAELTLQLWTFGSGFNGGDAGRVVRIHCLKLSDAAESDVPSDLLGPPQEFDKMVHSARRDCPKAETGLVYAVRSVNWDESDVLAAFQVVDLDTRGATIAWRILRTFDVPKRTR